MLKKLSIPFVLILALTSVALGATTWTVANQSTIGWDATTLLDDGTPIPAGDTVTYRVYIKKDGETGDGTQAYETAQLQQTITFGQEGRWLVGIQAVRAPENNPDNIQVSQIVWSNTEDVALVPVAFGFIYYMSPRAVSGVVPK